jgi:hypothetical protein
VSFESVEKVQIRVQLTDRKHTTLQLIFPSEYPVEIPKIDILDGEILKTVYHKTIIKLNNKARALKGEPMVHALY